MHDRDTKFTASFDDVLESAKPKVMKTAYRSPNTVAFVEQFIQTLQQECLDYFIVFGEQHMDHLVSEMVTHYHEERPHQSKDNDSLVPATPATEPKKTKRKNKECSPDVVRISRIECRQRLGGPLNRYYRDAA